MEKTYLLQLSEKERQVYELVVKGFTNKEISSLLKISDNAVKGRLKNIYLKFDVTNRTELTFVSRTPKNHHDIIGLWLSRYEYFIKYGEKKLKGIQYNIENISPGKMIGSFEGENIECIDNRGNKYYHSFSGTLNDDYFRGEWLNKNTKDLGCFLLHITNNSNLMLGQYLGSNSFSDVDNGPWEWIKISDEEFSSLELLDFSKLENKYLQWFRNGIQIQLKDVTKNT